MKPNFGCDGDRRRRSRGSWAGEGALLQRQAAPSGRSARWRRWPGCAAAERRGRSGSSRRGLPRLARAAYCFTAGTGVERASSARAQQACAVDMGGGERGPLQLAAAEHAAPLGSMLQLAAHSPDHSQHRRRAACGSAASGSAIGSAAARRPTRWRAAADCPADSPAAQSCRADRSEPMCGVPRGDAATIIISYQWR